ncbi:MAG TPA: universal stress protein [Terriglobia bacterium]|nr:universal stress protein [Terriglobia bacterium]
MKRPERILIGLKTLDHACELTELACHLGAAAASLLLVHVIELPDSTPLYAEVPELESTAKEILDKAFRIAASNQMQVRTLTVRAHSAASALLDEMKQNKIELSVLGYHHRRTLGEIILGTTAQHLVKNATCRLLFNIPPRS